jgi:hypothetical protein
LPQDPQRFTLKSPSHSTEDDHTQGEAQGEEHKTDGSGELEILVVQKTEDRRKGNQEAHDIQNIHPILLMQAFGRNQNSIRSSNRFDLLMKP